MKKTLLEKLEGLFGPITAYDGQYVVWTKVSHPNMARSSFDLRDVLPRFKGVTLEDLVEALPVFDKPKRGKVAVAETEEE
jgi:hypothetical protein